ncbi:MAG TPA: c-type cytochrome, partial [Pyrinomonadaceae bacterium]|nr:c-type cytochrome [Pyrinomonadaceae bacterium]
MARQLKLKAVPTCLLAGILTCAVSLIAGCHTKIQQPTAQSKLAEDSKPPTASTVPQARPLTDLKFERTAARIERGKYLAEGPLACFACHSEPDYDSPGAPPKPGRKGGGYVFTEDEAGVPGRLVAPNISPDPETGAGTWTDDMFARAIREGIGHDGRALFPTMLYQNFRKLSDEDLASVVVYVRSIPPVRNALPKRELSPEVLQSVQHIPKPITEPVPPPDVSTPVKNGEFLAHVADCYGCHTRTDKEDKPVFGAFGGGVMFKGPWGEAASSNITTDPSGI